MMEENSLLGKRLAESSLMQKTVVTIGTFDGLHLGHRTLLQRVREIAFNQSWPSLVFTFPEPPQNYFGRKKKLILPVEKKLELLAKEVNQVIIVDFKELYWMSPEEFVEQVLVEKLHAAAVVVGSNYRFGKARRGDAALLQKLGEELGFMVEIVPPVTLAGEIVSSTAVRKALSSGNIERARQLLGYPPLLCGRVIQGEGRGKELGFPTANLKIEESLITPDEGVFAARALFKGEVASCVVYIGRRPTFDGKEKAFEVHLLGEVPEILREGLYGLKMEVELLHKLRGDKRFPNPRALQEQIKADIEAAEALLRTDP